VALVRRCRFGFLAVLGLLIPTSMAVTGCDSGCDTTMTASAGSAHRTGSDLAAAQIHLDVSAKLTSGGKGVAGVRIGFSVTAPGSAPTDAAGAVTDSDGVARFSGPADYGLARALTSVTAARTISYVAYTMVVGSTPDVRVCNLLTARSQPAELRYQP
jgi:hypothetical protein